ncbi:MFS general substrate transporter [Acaromyces ingoldii]|uniref:MFS general substrate transporter n=1 Tax=Acaromyces ingoldii TaxID=215250 RepID=A0A316YP90_9BASI|nr:MFS general substrate transporter [Acaromyces ingoldii]PWN91041.1 MFS general substrate transporter [Acaromyces ingoldii]
MDTPTKKKIDDGAQMETASGDATPEPSGAIYIDWAEDDPEHPQNWPTRQKWICACTVMTFSFASASMSAGYGQAYKGVNKDLGPYPYVAYESGITVYLLGIAFAPLLLAPVSESFGRWPVMMVSAFCNLVLFLGQTLAQNLETIVVTRFIQGCVGSVGNSMSGGYFADMFPADRRGIVLSLYALCLFAAQSFSPVYASWVAQELSWRWIFWIQMMVCGVSFICFALFLGEPRASVLLKRRAKRLTKETGIPHRTRADDEAVDAKTLLKNSLGRPLRYLLTEPIIMFYSLWIGFGWACSYLLLSAIPIVFSAYGWNTGEQNLPQLCTFIGCFLSFVFNNVFQERLYRRDAARRADGTKPEPESRLYGCMVGAIAFPVGAFIFAWTGRPWLHWIGPCIGLVIINFGIFSIYLSAYTYLADAYEEYASSALAAQSCFRNTLASIFPLVSKTAYERMGTQWASTMVACIALVLGLLPFILKWRGAEIRARSPATIAIAREKEEREQARAKGVA